MKITRGNRISLFTRWYLINQPMELSDSTAVANERKSLFQLILFQIESKIDGIYRNVT